MEIDVNNSRFEEKGQGECGTVSLLNFLAVVGLIAGFIAALAFGWTDIGYKGQIEYFEFDEDFNFMAFAYYIIVGVSSYAIFSMFAILTKAAKKYLSK